MRFCVCRTKDCLCVCEIEQKRGYNRNFSYYFFLWLFSTEMTENSGRMDAFKSLTHKGTTESLRARRHEVTVELRKSKKDDQLFKRRNIHSESDEAPSSPLQENNGQTTGTPTTNIPEILLMLTSNDPQKNFDGVQTIRRMLSRERNPPIDLMINSGVVPYCVNFLRPEVSTELQFEAAWALTNIASGNSEQTRAVISNGGVARFIELLNSPEIKVAEQAVWALGNISGDGPELRDYVLSLRVVDHIIKMLDAEIPVSFMRNIVWLCSNLCRSKNPHPPFERIRPLIPILVELLKNCDEQILTDACWALSYVTDDESDKIQAVLDAGGAPLLVKLLDHHAITILTPALRTVGNIVTGTDTQTDAILEAGVIPRLANLLKHRKPTIVKETAWAISNIVAGTIEQIGQVLSSGILEHVVKVLATGDFKSQKEAAWIITNITTGGSDEQNIILIEQYPILKPYCDLLESHDPAVINIVLKGLENLFRLSDRIGGKGQLCLLIEETGGLDKLEGLQNHDNEEIYKQAYALVSTYFCDEDAAEEIQVTTTQDGGEFAWNDNAGNAPGSNAAPNSSQGYRF